MDNLISISIEGTGIEELPPSIGNLVGLQELSMTSCLSLKELPESFDMLQSLRNLDLEGCPQLRSFLTKLRELGQSSHTFDNVQSLNLENCGLIDEDLPVIFHCFPKLASLVLSGNDFVTLPSCIQEFPGLELLHLDNCKQLQEIPVIPPNLLYINAGNCTSLNAESSNLLLSQETFEAHELQVMVPGTKVPEWFDHCAKGEYLTFWLREKFPAIILCYALAVEGEMKKVFSCEVRFYINGEEVYELEIPRGFSEMVADHVWLFDLRTHLSIQWDGLDSYLVNDWNQLEISCDKISGAPNVTVSWCGVHVCKQEVNMKDILFTDPDHDLRSSRDFEEIDANLHATSKDSMASECLERTGSVKDYGSNTKGSDHASKAQPKFQVTNFIDMPNVKASSALDDAEMEAFYASLESETSLPSLTNETKFVSKFAIRMPSEKTQKELKTLQDFLTKDFSVLLGPYEYSAMKATLEYLTNLPSQDGVSLEMRSLIIEVSRQFTHWSCDYADESKKIEAATAKLLKADVLEEGLESNKLHFRELMWLENEVCNELAYLEERKKELDEQINAVKARIFDSESVRDMATYRKREMFGEAKMLKVERDELREKVPHLKDEQELAKKVQANIRAEWSKIGEKFNSFIKK